MTKRVSKAVQRFFRRDDGSVAVLTAVTVIPAMAAIGGAIEFSRLNSVRVAAQAAADTAVLAAASKANLSQTERQAIAAGAVNAIFGARAAALRLQIVETDVSAGLYEVKITGDAPTVLQKLIGMERLSFSVTSRATTSGVSAAKPLELALALDNTGSMSANMGDLKAAAKAMVDAVMGAGGGAARVSVVPYVAVVNPGLTDAASVANYIDTTAVSPFNGQWYRDYQVTQGAGCVPNWGGSGGGSGGGAGSGGTGDARDILDILAPIRRMAQELFGVTSAHAADVTPNTVAPLTLQSWTSPATGITYRIPVGFYALDANYPNNGACDWFKQPAIVSQYELFKRTRDQNNNPTRWKGCVEVRVSKTEQTWLNANRGWSYPASTDYDVTDTPPSTADSLSLFVPYFWPDEPDFSPFNTTIAVPPGPYSSATQGFHNNYLMDTNGQIQASWGWTPVAAIDYGAGSWLMKYDGATKAAIIQETPDAAGYTYGPNAGCPDPVLRLTNNTSTVKSKIDGLSYWQSGGTIISEGLMWAWRTLSPRAPYADGAAYGTPGVEKVIVLMTDGVNELIDNGNNAAALTTKNVSDYSAYGYLGDTRLWNANAVTNYAAFNTLMDNRLLAACRNAKAAGVKIYTVTFNHAGYLTSAQQAAAQTLLGQCASQTNYAYTATDAASLTAVFTAIGASASGSGLRLVK
ncbi:MAG: VWA domain-containing protein [Methylobacteriaceae bacterium]|nr:VWA domain-containing protein [Rhodoblastus sp.]MCC0005783.1 VWA domain-containing protein [Methylobacteriaceae bacterium]